MENGIINNCRNYSMINLKIVPLFPLKYLPCISRSGSSPHYFFSNKIDIYLERGF